MYRRRFVSAYSSTSPARPPDWQWRRASQIVEEGAYATNLCDGEVVCRTVQYTRGLRRVCSERGVRNLAKRYPDVFLAFQVHQELGLRPLEIKARVLARQNDAAIAWRVGLPVKTVATYTSLFVDVRSRIWGTSRKAQYQERKEEAPNCRRMG